MVAHGFAAQGVTDNSYGNTVGDSTDAANAGTGTFLGTTTLTGYGIPNNANGLGTQNTQNTTDILTGYFTPAVTGSYTFAMASDDGGIVKLSTDATAANAVAIITQKDDWTGFQQYNGEQNGAAANNFSAAIPLVGGVSYYLEGDHAQGGGGRTLTSQRFWELLLQEADKFQTALPRSLPDRSGR